MDSTAKVHIEQHHHFTVLVIKINVDARDLGRETIIVIMKTTDTFY